MENWQQNKKNDGWFVGKKKLDTGKKKPKNLKKFNVLFFFSKFKEKRIIIKAIF